DSIQEQAFLRASAMARDWKCLVFVCLRPATFSRSRNSGVLDSVAPRVIVVAPPLTRPLLVRRFDYALGLLSGVNSPGKSISHHLPSTKRVLQRVRESFNSDAKLCRLFDSLSNGNVRALLQFVQQALINDHLDTEKISDKPSYLMPVHEALRSILYGEHLQYDPTHSPVVNLFDALHADKIEHFSRFLLLHYLSRQRSLPQNTRGLRSVTEVETYMCQLGYTPAHVTATLKFLFDKHCCECSVPGVTWANRTEEFRITDWGTYHINNLVNEFQYVDAMVIDTPIMDDSVRETIQHVRYIRDRIVRCQHFVDYLDNAMLTMKDDDATLAWAEVARTVREDIEYIKARIEKK
ncbi:hypothetical protein LCGC14_2386730, partial [marine sediment metagenome]